MTSRIERAVAPGLGSRANRRRHRELEPIGLLTYAAAVATKL